MEEVLFSLIFFPKYTVPGVPLSTMKGNGSMVQCKKGSNSIATGSHNFEASHLFEGVHEAMHK